MRTLFIAAAVALHTLCDIGRFASCNIAPTLAADPLAEIVSHRTVIGAAIDTDAVQRLHSLLLSLNGLLFSESLTSTCLS